MLFEIKSTKNERYKHFKALKTKKERMKTHEYTVEGKKSVADAIAAGADIHAILVSEGFYRDESFSYGKNDIFCFPEAVFDGLSATDTPSGIIGVLGIEREDTVKLELDKPYIYCDRVADPGNLGTIIRTADAAGFGGVLLSPGCADVYNPKTVRSSMGSFFHIKVSENIDAVKLGELKSSGFSIVCGCLSDKTTEYTRADMRQPIIIVVGNESNGISEEILKNSDIAVKIPIIGSVESLNVSVAAALLMYETVRQRRE